MNINDKIIFRTCGRGVTRVWKGTIKYNVKAGKLPGVTLRKEVPHGEQPSNRDRFIVALDKTGTLVWANATGPNIVAAGKKLPEHNPRLAKPVRKAKVKVKAKPVAKVKTEAVAKPEKRTVNEALNAAITKRSGGDKPKATWYGIVGDKVVSVRKVICPEGFSKDKPVLTAPIEPKDVVTTKPETHIPESSAPPAAEPAALPQASAV